MYGHGREKCDAHLMKTRPASKSRSHSGGTRHRTKQLVKIFENTMTRTPRRCVLVSGLGVNSKMDQPVSWASV